MAAVAEDNVKALGGKGKDGDLTDEQEAADNADKASREEAKNRIRKIMRRAEKRLQKMPMWRHRLKGVNDPPPESVLKGKALWRVIAKSVICMFVRPKLAIQKRRKKFRNEEQRELEKDLSVFSDYFSGLLARQVKVPLSSVEHDRLLDLDPRGVRGETLKTRLMQLKVRVKGVVGCLCDSELPPLKIKAEAGAEGGGGGSGSGGGSGGGSGENEENDNPLVMFLLRLIDDNNYFPERFLSEAESSVLEFNDLGGTRNMLVAADGNSSAPTLPYGMKRSEVLLGADKTRKVDATRARLVLTTFVVIRVLIGQVVLTPWHYGVCKKPKSRAVTIANNCRTLASAIYMLMQHIDTSMPNIVPEARVLGAAGLGMGAGGPGAGSDGADASSEVLAKNEKRLDSLGAAKAASLAAEGLGAGAGRAGGGLGFLGSLLGGRGKDKDADTPQRDLSDDSLAMQLAEGPHLDFTEPVQTIRNVLLPTAELVHAKALMAEWIPELASKLNGYLQRLLEHLLALRAQSKGSFDDEVEQLEKDKATAKALGLDLGKLDASKQQAGAAMLSGRGAAGDARKSARGGGGNGGQPQASARQRPGTRQKLPPPTPLAAPR